MLELHVMTSGNTDMTTPLHRPTPQKRAQPGTPRSPRDLAVTELHPRRRHAIPSAESQPLEFGSGDVGVPGDKYRIRLRIAGRYRALGGLDGCERFRVVAGELGPFGFGAGSKRIQGLKLDCTFFVKMQLQRKMTWHSWSTLFRSGSKVGSQPSCSIDCNMENFSAEIHTETTNIH